MAEKRNAVLYTDTLRKIEENRGDMSQADFIDHLIDTQFPENHGLEDKEHKETSQTFVTKEELRSFEKDIKKLLREFLNFFITYSVELGKPSRTNELEEITKTLRDLDKEIEAGNKRIGTIKYK